MSFKIVTPILHCAVLAAQVHGSRIFYMMWKRQMRFLREGGKGREREEEGGGGGEGVWEGERGGGGGYGEGGE